MNKKIIFICALLFLWAKFCFATVSASVNRVSVELGQSLTLTIQLKSSFDTPNLDPLNNDFDIYGTSTNSQTSIVNGQTSSQTTFVANLVPKKLGKQLIPAIQVGSDKTAPIQIEVTQAPTTSLNGVSTTNKKLFVTANISDSSSYQGVPVLYSVKFYYAVSLSGVRMEPLQINNAQIQPLDKSIQYSDNIKGNDYQVIEQHFLITPNQSGEINIPAATLRGNMIDGSTTTMNSFFSMMMPRPFMVSSNSLVLKVKPVPSSITPDKWFPAKEVNASESWSALSDNLTIGEPLTRTITLSVLGVPPTSIPEFSFGVPLGVNAYPDKSVENSSSGIYISVPVKSAGNKSGVN